MGVHKAGKIPHVSKDVSKAGMGVHKIRHVPHASDFGMGVHEAGRSVQDPYNTNIYEWFRELSERLRYVRVVCGDWTKVCGGNWQDKCGTVGMFFDPPYGVVDRDRRVYHHDTVAVADEVKEWARDRGKKRSYRIVIAGYEEHEDLLSEGWTCERWRAKGGYSNAGNGRGKENKERETLYFSPHCISKVGKQRRLFE